MFITLNVLSLMDKQLQRSNEHVGRGIAGPKAGAGNKE